MSQQTKKSKEYGSTKKWLGIIIIVSIFITLIILLVMLTTKPFLPNTKEFDKSIIIQQRIINLDKSRK